MRIGIDARLYKKGLGIGRYIEELLLHLETLGSNDEYIIFLRSEMMEVYKPLRNNFTKVCIDVPWYSLAEQIVLPLVLMKHRLDVMHFPHFNVPLLYCGDTIVTIHDLLMMKRKASSRSAVSTKHPLVHWFKYQCYRIVVSVACYRARAIIAVSQCTKDDIIRLVGVSHSKIFVIHEGVHSFGDAKEEPILAVIHTPYYINVGNAYPHKNCTLLLDTFERLQEQQDPAMLVFCGQEDYFRDALRKEIIRRGLRNTVHVGYVSNEQLASLYQNAEAALFPSFEEGFGLGALEALSQGTPVIASRIPCFQEILGTAAHFIDPTDVDDMLRAIQTLKSDQAYREKLQQNGYGRIAYFSWHSAAQETHSLYHANHV